MTLEPYTVDIAAVGFQAESGLPAMSDPGESLTVTTRCDRLLAFWPRGAAVRDAGRAGTVPAMRTQTGDVAGTLDTMGPGTGQAAKGGVLYPDLDDRLGIPASSALERGDFPLPPVEMLAVSTFSGVGGLDRGLRLAGIESVLQAEQDEWCRGVLAHRFPGTSQISDVRNVDLEHVDAALAAWEEFHRGTEGVPESNESGGPRGGRQGGEVGDDRPRGNARGSSSGPAGGRRGASRIDLLHGGFPCQDVSVAGRRAGLDGARTGLFFEFARIADALRPSWVLLENVPGLLTSNGGRDFGVILDTMAQLGYGLAWRVLDSRYFGVPQRRRRVFVVGRLGGDGASALRALCESCGGSAEAGACSWQTPALRTRARPAPDGGLDVAGALTRRHAGTSTARDGVDNLAISGPLLGGGNDRGYRLGAEESASLVFDEESDGDQPTYYADGSEDGTLRPSRSVDHTLVAHTLTAGGFDASEDGTGRGTPIVPTDPAQLRLPDQAVTLTASGGGSNDPELENLIPAGGQRTRYFDWQKAGAHAMGIEEEMSGSLGTTRRPAILQQQTPQPFVVNVRGRDGEPVAEVDVDGLPNLRASASGHANLIAPRGVSATLQAKRGKGGGGLGPEETLLPIPLTADTANGRSGDNPNPGPDAEGNVRSRPSGLGVGEHGDPSFTLSTGAPPAVWAMQPGQGDDGEVTGHRVDVAPALDATAEARSTDRGVRVRAAAGVRRLTPVECERLQGFPDGWTSVPGLKCPDGRRYASMGNAVTVNVGEWIGRRIVAEHLSAQE